MTNWPGTAPALAYRAGYGKKSLQLPKATDNAETDAPEMVWGTVAPNGTMVGVPGDLYIQTVPGGFPALWTKVRGTGNTGWFRSESGIVNVQMFGAIGDGLTDDSAAVQLAIDAASAAGGGVVFFPVGVYLLYSTLTVPNYVTLQGVNTRKSVLRSGAAVRMIQGLGQYTAEGSTRNIHVTLANLMLDGNTTGTQGFYLKGGIQNRIHDCRFFAFTKEFLYFDQVFDSVISETYFINADLPGVEPVVMLRYGNGENTDQIHFNDCVWETFNRYAVQTVSGAGAGERVNEIFFDNCKFESIYPVTHFVLDRTETLFFSNCTWTMARNPSGTPAYCIESTSSLGVYFVNCLAEYFQVGANEYSFFNNVSGNGPLSFMNLRVFGTAPQQPIRITGGQPYIFQFGVTVNDVPTGDVYTGETAIRLNQIYGRFGVVSNSEECSIQIERTGTGARRVALGRVDVTGAVKLIHETGGDVVMAQWLNANHWRWERAVSQKVVALTDAAPVVTDADLGNYFTLTATAGRTISAPTNGQTGQLITYEILNSSGGAMTTTWNGAFHLHGVWVDPANGRKRTITFRNSGSGVWEETSRSYNDDQTTADFKVSNDADFTGGYRQTIDGWFQENVAAAQTDVALTRLATTTEVPTRWIATRAGSVTGVSVKSNAARTLGTLTIKVFKNGVALGTLTAVLDGTNTTFKATTQAKDIDTFVAGDELELRITTDGTWAPTTGDIRAALEIES